MARVAFIRGTQLDPWSLLDAREEFEILAKKSLRETRAPGSLHADMESARRWRALVATWKATLQARLAGGTLSYQERQSTIALAKLIDAHLTQCREVIRQFSEAAERARYEPEPVDRETAAGWCADFQTAVAEIARPFLDRFDAPDDMRAAWGLACQALRRRFEAMRRSLACELRRDIERQLEAAASDTAKAVQERTVLTTKIGELEAALAKVRGANQKLEQARLTTELERRSAVLEADRYRREALYLGRQLAEFRGQG